MRKKSLESPKPRDKCFVLMPFGGWFDRYYKEIYVPAIMDAGFEPVRADEVFKSGIVLEQIREEISKAKVCLAHLTNKNTNVPYEVGFAHGVGTPVILIAADINDVPSNLRGSRTILYNTNDPYWGAQLKENITAFLKNQLDLENSSRTVNYQPIDRNCFSPHLPLPLQQEMMRSKNGAQGIHAKARSVRRHFPV